MLIFKGVIESLKKSLKDIHTRLCGISGGWEVVYDKETWTGTTTAASSQDGTSLHASYI